MNRGRRRGRFFDQWFESILAPLIRLGSLWHIDTFT
jgi:hypothetical protein